jgi:hypothetical protein
VQRLHCILAVSSCCGKDLGTWEGGILSYASLAWVKRMELKNAQKRLSHLQRMTCLGITGGMSSTPTSALDSALKLYAVSSRVVHQCGDSLQELASSNRVRLVWVPGNCGIHEEANALGSNLC